MDPDGDLVLQVGSRFGSPREFRVCSATMRRTSPVWKNMLFGVWKEAKPTAGPWVVDLPEDKPEPVHGLLAIIHSKFHLVHSSYRIPRLSQLHDILVVTDKYDMISVIQPWARTWVQQVRIPVDSVFGTPQSDGHDCILRIHVAWELGIDDLLSTDISELIFNSTITTCQATKPLRLPFEQKVVYKGQVLQFDSNAGPSDIVETIAEHRSSLIQTLLDFYHAEVKCRTRDEGECRATAGAVVYSGGIKYSERQLCDSLILGSLFRTQQRLGYSSLPLEASKYFNDANFLMGTLSSIFTALPYLSDRHRGCPPSKKYVEFEVRTKADPRWLNVLGPEHKQRMEAQRKILGLP
ncbi:hypothetical protein N658DRAFT_517483 [Parathielavia hyrcaniae]|uniref:Nuclear pore protein n=1 Tax=Parathielavia hyrcaniae TaxID=113614 RepID=A0AAN6PWE7_9PEZI|nr:hypothetical protein N658DRAFT_517483 [Parathielavia hyrcaniae]